MILSFTQLRAEWLIAGGSPKEADTAAAVAMAESHGRMGASNLQDPYGGSWGPWEINGVHPFVPSALTSDPYYSAIAAVYVHHKSGWMAWSTYRYGQYKAFLPHHRMRTVKTYVQQRHLEQRASVRQNPMQVDPAPLAALNNVAISFALAAVFFGLLKAWSHVLGLWRIAIREEVAVQKRAVRRRRLREREALRKRTMPRTVRRAALA